MAETKKNATVNNEETNNKEVENMKEEAAQKTEQAVPEAPKEEQKDLPAEVKPEEEKEGFFAKAGKFMKEKVAPKAKRFGAVIGLIGAGYALAKINQSVTDRKLADLAEKEDSSGSYEPEDEVNNDLEIDEINQEES